ncbi:hypothetical protein Scep_003862 [Stephania cephalantha]|uniref:Uncharacterized protein n=1 Tax=Stephania cephalantha TaxID=152367 RepID=A0AAP0KRB5_9MAGN
MVNAVKPPRRLTEPRAFAPGSSTMAPVEQLLPLPWPGRLWPVMVPTIATGRVAWMPPFSFFLLAVGLPSGTPLIVAGGGCYDVVATPIDSAAATLPPPLSSSTFNSLFIFQK